MRNIAVAEDQPNRSLKEDIFINTQLDTCLRATRHRQSLAVVPCLVCIGWLVFHRFIVDKYGIKRH